MTTYERRLQRLEQSAPGVGATEVPILSVPSLPEEDQIAFAAAEQSGDWAAIADLTEKYTGTRPASGGRDVGLVIVGCVGARCP